ncbi:MAG: ParB/RepB/Spo0J family partition protein [Candidatus Dojkabacteria bacterium]|nr:ParB/RepB/Spo0J family partition protein [Candidatus Dojkabacteria bacterium]MDQ7020348.1 ParB/RepB/Spo0J family partition protein [Candidatus Dojkabacteria bacterium]
MARKSALGQGLSALIDKSSVNEISNGFIAKLPINLVVANPYQPRAQMNPEKLVELADSMREYGVIEPLLVTKKSENNYELIAGERRLRAAKLAGLKFVPVVVKEATPKEMLELAVIENIQREDLNALEEGLAFQQLSESFKMTHEQISKKVGISRPAIANKIRLLTLPEDIKKGLLEEKISEGHARALLGLKSEETMIATYKIILRDKLSVRAVEELVRRLNKGQMKTKKSTNRIIDKKTLSIETGLRERFGKSVSLARTKKGGKIVIPFKDDSELDDIVEKIF